MALLEVALTLWTLNAALWWMCALRLVGRRCNQSRLTHLPASRSPRPRQQQPQRLTIFKPCPPLRAGVQTVSPALVCALESFLFQLDARHDELLLGLHVADRAAWEPHVRRWRECYPSPTLQVVYRDGAEVAERHANPKIAWQHELAPLATGELWMSSDADIVAPPGFLCASRARFAAMPAAGFPCVNTGSLCSAGVFCAPSAGWLVGCRGRCDGTVGVGGSRRRRRAATDRPRLPAKSRPAKRKFTVRSL